MKLNHVCKRSPMSWLPQSCTPQDQYQMHQKTAMDLAHHFAENTSLGGLATMNTSKRWWSTGFWIAIIVFALLACLAHLYCIFQNYYKYPYSIVDEIKYDFLPFPSVTICNRNPVRISAIPDLPQNLQDYLLQMNPTTQPPDQGSGPGPGPGSGPAPPLPPPPGEDSGLAPPPPQWPPPPPPPPPPPSPTFLPNQFATSSEESTMMHNVRKFLETYGNVSL